MALHRHSPAHSQSSGSCFREDSQIDFSNGRYRGGGFGSGRYRFKNRFFLVVKPSISIKKQHKHFSSDLKLIKSYRLS